MGLLKYLHEDYEESEEVKGIQRALEVEINELLRYIDDCIKQLFVDKATWGLSLWEGTYGIKTNTNKSIDERRAVIKAKMRGKDTTTVEVIESVAEAFMKEGNAYLVEEFNKYAFTLNLSSKSGFPYSLDGLYNIIEEIKPAHLRANYKLISILSSKLYIGTYSSSGEEITVYPYITKDLSTKGTINIALGSNAILENITIYPKRG